jgi:hypothetical protein
MRPDCIARQRTRMLKYTVFCRAVRQGVRPAKNSADFYRAEEPGGEEVGLDGAHENSPGSAQAGGFDIVPLIRRGLRYQSLVAFAIAGILALAVGPVES